MAEYKLDGIGIKGISCAVPSNVVDSTQFYEKFGKEAVDNFIEMTGVRSSHRSAEEQTASDLCYVAAKNLIEKKGIDPEERSGIHLTDARLCSACYCMCIA